MKLSKEFQMIFSIIDFIYSCNECEKHIDYARNHPLWVRDYAATLNHRMHLGLDQHKLDCVCYAHDIFKERGLDPSKPNLVWNNHEIPQDLNRYVRMNLDFLEEFNMDEYFNSDAGLHGLASGIFLRKEFGIKDPEIIYPIIFHSCPIMSIYSVLPKNIQDMCDVVVLADKLASNRYRIEVMEKAVPCDLDLIVFGPSGLELNYTLGVYIAMLMKQSTSKGEQSKLTVAHYYKRLHDMNPCVCEYKLGGNVKWPVRKSTVLKTR